MTEQEIDDLIAEFRPLRADKLVGYGGLAMEVRNFRALVRRAMQEGARRASVDLALQSALAELPKPRKPSAASRGASKPQPAKVPTP